MVRILKGLPAEDRDSAARLYWEAFGGKLTTVLGPDARAQDFLLRVIRPDHCYCAVEDGRLVGIAGFKTPQGSFAGGGPADLRAIYGPFGALWRGLALRLLASDVDNDRFLVDGIAVTRTARGQGIGRALLSALCDEAMIRGYPAIRLEVVDSNWRARALYEREGFVVTDTQKLGLLSAVFGFSAALTMVRPLQAQP